MQETTKKLARHVQQALLALSDETLSETLSEILGYHVSSRESGRIYESLEALDEAEPEAGEISWIAPAPSHLREVIGKKQASQVYHQLIALAGLALRQTDVAAQWPDPPDPESRRDGYAFIQCLERYLILRREAGCATTDQFEVQYAEQLAAIAESFPEPERETFFLGFFSNEHIAHFRVDFIKPDRQRYQELRQALHRHDFLFSASEEANCIEGSVFYVPGREDDLKALRHVQRLLKGWQEAGRITFTERKEHPPKRHSSQKQKQRRRRRK